MINLDTEEGRKRAALTLLADLKGQWLGRPEDVFEVLDAAMIILLDSPIYSANKPHPISLVEKAEKRLWPEGNKYASRSC